MSMVKPTLKVLTADQIENINNKVLTILAETGIRVDDANARRVFKTAGCMEIEEDRYCIPRDIVAWAVQSAPSRIEVFNRDGGTGFQLDSHQTDNTVFGIGVTNLYYQEALSDEVVQFNRGHMAQATRLGEALAAFDVISTPGVIQDVPTREAELTGVLEMLANTKKPLVLLVSEPNDFATSLEMMNRLIGHSKERPFVIPYLNPITPLILNAETTLKMDLAVAMGLPLIFSNYGMSGATSPITPGGTLALLTAELVAGLVYAQLLKEGAPIVLGSLPATFDMKTMQSYYSPQSMLLNLACAEMMTHYGIPHCGTSGGWMGWGPDLMAGAMLWANHLSSVLGSVGLVPFVGNNFDSLAFSPTTVVYAAEIIRFAREYGQGFSLEPDEIGLKEIMTLGPGANYLTSQLTMKKFKASLRASPVWPMLSLEKWEEKGRPKAGEVLRRHTHDLLNEITPPPDHDEILAVGEEFITNLS